MRKIRSIAGVALLCLFGAVCGCRHQRPRTLSEDRVQPTVPIAIGVRSPAFGDGQAIPPKYATAEDLTPPIEWSNVPPAARSIVLIVEDPDAPQPTPFVHWIIYNIPPDLGGLDEGIRHDETLARPPGARQGRNSAGQIGYYHPDPPPGKLHHYHFQVFALDKEIAIPGDITRKVIDREMKDHVLARGEMVGTFKR